MSKNCKICWIILGLFFAANVALLSLWWAQSNRQTDRPRGERTSRDMNRFRKHLEDNIGIDSAQFGQFNQLRRKHFNLLNKNKIKIDSVEKLLRLETFSENGDSIKAMELIDEVILYQKQMEVQNYQHYRQLRSICRNSAQRERLDNSFRNLIDMKQGRHRHRQRSGRSK